MEFSPAKIFDKKLLYLLIGFIALDAVSFLAYQSAWLGWLSFFILLVAAIIIAAINLEYGVYILLSDLILGGLGYLFFIDVGGFRLPLRLGLFAGIFGVWLVKMILKNNWSFLKDKKILALILFGLFWLGSCAMGIFFGRS
jgi:hypothetical protein